MLTAAAPAQAVDTDHGCPSGSTCGYLTATDYSNNHPAVMAREPTTGTSAAVRFSDTGDASASGRFEAGGSANNRVAYNFTDPMYTSEGNFVLMIPGVLCVYVPDTSDEQAPDTTETLPDSRPITAVQFGQTAAEADAISVTALGNCG
ncbi:hypothetical protein ACQPW1_10610 [Nocardia sp. CA-128927]|uniref:hypothetical protein n=1 Tax=Nocardia sp. CA-128927 TaxID=3239975 RepID=UPI003D99EE90